MKRLVIVSSNYPSKKNPARGAFVYNLVQQLCNHYDVTVVSPFNLKHQFNKGSVDYGNERAHVIRPWYLSVGNRRLFGVNLERVSLFFAKIAVHRTLRALPFKPDLIYAHFFVSGMLAEQYTVKNKVPLIVASGESSYNGAVFNRSRIRSFLKHVSFVVCVSETNYSAVKSLGFNPANMRVVPNSVDYDLFSPSDKNQAKRKLGLSTHKFVVGFIGHFIYRKGINRVIDAIASLNDPDIVLVAVGSGEITRSNAFVKFIKPVPNAQLPQIISAFDIFVLPTLSEGHCNVIEEVKACLVPVISSKGTSVEKQIDDSTGILIDPLDIEEIAEKIKLLKDDSLKLWDMKKALSNQRGLNSLSARAQKIKSIIDSFIVS